MNANENHRLPLKWKDGPRWLQVIWIIAFLNFFSFYFIAAYLGGDAVSGKETPGHFYLGNKSKSGYAEVSEKIFRYSKIHTYSIWVTHSLAILSLVGFISRRKTPPAL